MFGFGKVTCVCPACATSVRGTQDIGLFVDLRSLGHADCGGARVLRA